MNKNTCVNANIKFTRIANIKVNRFDKKSYAIASKLIRGDCNEKRSRNKIKNIKVFKYEAKL